jgi:acylphosphatase
MPQLHLLVSGRVQGVGFRYYALTTARRLNVAGWVRNLPDGQVEIEAEGTRPALEEFARAMRAGPSASAVEDCAERWREQDGGLRGFRIVG